MMMGAAAFGSSPAGSAVAIGACDPVDPRLLTPGEAERRRLNCVRPGGFGSSGYRVHRYFGRPGG